MINYFINYLGIGDWGLGPIPNPQSPIPKNKFNNKLNNKLNITIKEQKTT